jgi:uncharacterized membrane protein YoaK (UPF0700 family)
MIVALLSFILGAIVGALMTWRVVVSELYS